jgi:hypothetical protein
MENIELQKRAWLLAHKLIFLGRAVAEREGADLLNVKTAEVCKAMGKPEGAALEEVQRFVYRVLSFMKGYGMYTATGCGYLSLMVAREERRDQALEENRDLVGFTPEDLEAFWAACVEQE